MRYCQKILFLGLLINSINTCVLSQQSDFSYIQYTKKDGLPSNKVYSTCKDKNGMLWIGTDAGLSKFDGNKFITFTINDGLPNNDVFQLFCDSKNRIWILTLGKDFCFIHNDKIHNKFNDMTIRKFKTEVKSVAIFEDKFGAIWGISYPFILNELSNNSLRVHDFSKFGIVCFNYAETEDGICFITDDSTYFYSYKEKIFLAAKVKNTKQINGIKILSNKCYFLNENFIVEEDSVSAIKSGTFYSRDHFWSLYVTANKIWQSRNNGLYLYRTDNLAIPKIFLKNLSVSNLVDDNYGNIWISTLNSGIFKLNSYKFIYFKPMVEEFSNSINSLLINSTYFILGNSKGSFSIIRRYPRMDTTNVTINENSNSTYRILKFLVKANILFISTDIGVFRYNIESKQLKRITGFYATKNIYWSNDSLIILDNISVTYFDKYFIKIKENNKSIRFYSYAKYNNVKLFGSENALYYEADSLIPYQLDQPFNYRLMDMKVVDSLLIIATTEKGVFFIKDHKIIRNINQENGLSSNNCNKIVPYKNQLYIATNNGLSIYNYSNNTMRKVFESDGLASNNVLDIVVEMDTIYAGTDDGLSIMPIADLKFKESFMYFINPVINNKDTIWDRVQTFKTRTDYPIHLTLNAITLGVKGNVKYFYRIKNMHSKFITTSDPNINLNFSSPGTYQFESYSMDINGLKSVMTYLQIQVIPYWYQTYIFKWAVVLFILVGLFLIYLWIVQLVKKRENRRNEYANRIKKLELDAWKSNINPHFLFNSFNTLQSLFNTSQFEKANDFVANFSGLLRKTIDNSSKLMNKFPEEIGYIENYLALERVKKSNKFDYVLNIEDQQLSDCYIPTLLIQPILENVIKHGFQTKTDGLIQIEFKTQDDYVICTVKDNGKGLPSGLENAANSKGLKLVRDKIRIIENVTHKRIDFSITNHFDTEQHCTGVIAIFKIPFFTHDDYDMSN